MSAMEPERLVGDLESATRATRQLDTCAWSLSNAARQELSNGIRVSLGHSAHGTCEVVGDHVSLTRSPSRHRCLTPQLDDDTRRTHARDLCSTLRKHA